MNIEGTIRDYLPNIIHMALATSAGDKPWVCQVHYAYDEELNIYFCSNAATRHCQEIAANPNVAGSISMQYQPGEKPLCVDFEGTAEMIAEITEENPAYLTYNGRFPGRTNLIEFLQQENGGRLYKITVSDYYVSDGQKQHLPWLRQS